MLPLTKPAVAVVLFLMVSGEVEIGTAAHLLVEEDALVSMV